MTPSKPALSRWVSMRASGPVMEVRRPGRLRDPAIQGLGQLEGDVGGLTLMVEEERRVLPAGFAGRKRRSDHLHAASSKCVPAPGGYAPGVRRPVDDPRDSRLSIRAAEQGGVRPK